MNIIVLSACMAAVTLAAVLIGYNFGASAGECPVPSVVAVAPQYEEHPPEETPEPATSTIHVIEPPAPSGSISIPGFERLIVQGQTILGDGIINPERNSCYFIIALTLSDGTEVYRSGILAPGQSAGNADLSKVLAPGTYDGAVARYSCYALESMKPLNGAEITFALEVQP